MENVYSYLKGLCVSNFLISTTKHEVQRLGCFFFKGKFIQWVTEVVVTIACFLGNGRNC